MYSSISTHTPFVKKIVSPNMTTDVENGSEQDHFTIGDDDASTLQPPPSEMDHHPAIDVDLDADDDEETAHDQLPTPEEYKARMKDGFATSSSPSKSAIGSQEDASGDDNDEVHDQLPSVEEYKASTGFHESPHKKSRAGLYTFLALVLVTVIATA